MFHRAGRGKLSDGHIALLAEKEEVRGGMVHRAPGGKADKAAVVAHGDLGYFVAASRIAPNGFVGVVVEQVAATIIPRTDKI